MSYILTKTRANISYVQEVYRERITTTRPSYEHKSRDRSPRLTLQE